MFKNLKKAFKTLSPVVICAGFIFTILIPQISQATIGISTPSVSSGELIRASDWNKVKLDLETIAAAVGSLQNQTWDSSGSDTYYDSGNVGVGINSPTATMHLFATTPAANAVLFQIGTTDDPDRVRIDEDGDMTIDGKLVVRGGDIYESGGDLELSGEDSLYLSMDWNNNDADTQSILFGKNDDGAGVDFVELMRIMEGGNVGIGTDAPASKLQVDGAIQIGSDAGVCDAAKTGAMRYNGGAIERCDGTAWDALATTNVSDNMGSHIATQTLDLDVFTLVGNGGTEGITIAADGKVGVGVAVPTEMLDIAGGLNLSDVSGNATIKGNNRDFMVMGASGSSYIKSIGVGTSIKLEPNNSTAMMLTASGDIGIGTTTPDSLLQIEKTAPTANEVILKVGTDADASRFSVDEDGDVFNDGNYYIGGGNILASNSSVTLGGEDNLYLVTDWNNNDAENRSIIFGKNGVGGGGGFAELARINENGKVGINTNDPKTRLHIIENDTSKRIATFENNATTGSPEGLLVLTGQGAGPAPAFAVGTGTEAAHTNNFVVTNSGHVGIGTANPSHLLSIGDDLGAISGNNALTIGESGVGNTQLFLGNDLGNFGNLYWDGANDDLHIRTKSAGSLNEYQLVLDSMGNVGMGTATPTATLHITDTKGSGGYSLDINDYLRFRGDGELTWGPSGSHGIISWEVGEAQMGSRIGTDLSIFAGGGEKIRVSASGETNISSISFDGTGKVVCIKSTGDLGTCTNAPNGSGVCSCS